ncbi:Acetylcholine receptor subunit alpha-type acr-16 [Trichinella zimbabwensis]|uniref:Acetylcholine receptor subunit alpha-type acr-16 n=1 Tax=Trichinella zimbabwensis TaxID=268475 RepID=A0A0V1HHB7_9BILA|nr:Acetylcholine receptor subunit alpha-type acr-16 [Trichinella zimbabwensis]
MSGVATSNICSFFFQHIIIVRLFVAALQQHQQQQQQQACGTSDEIVPFLNRLRQPSSAFVDDKNQSQRIAEARSSLRALADPKIWLAIGQEVFVELGFLRFHSTCTIISSLLQSHIFVISFLNKMIIQILFLLFFITAHYSTTVDGQSVLKPPKLYNPHSNSFNCVDQSSKCSMWASRGECFANPSWMIRNCPHSCQACQGGNKVWDLRNEIISKYNSSSQNQKFTVEVINIKAVSVKHFETDEQEQVLKIYGTLLMTWNDSRIQWNKTEWGIAWMNLVWSQIWTPKLVALKSAPMDSSQFESDSLAVHHTGAVLNWVDFVLETYIQFDYSRYPYDQQSGCVRFGDRRDFSIRFEVDQNAEQELMKSLDKLHPVSWTIRSAQIREGSNPEKVLSLDMDDETEAFAPVVDLCVSFKRDNSYTFALFFLPCAATAMITVLSFLLSRQWNKIMLLVVSVGLQIFFLASLTNHLPPSNGRTPVIVKFCSCSMVITCILILAELTFGSLERIRSALPPPRWLMITVNRVNKFCPVVLGSADRANKVVDDQHSDHIVDLGAPPNTGSVWSPAVRILRFIMFLFVITFYMLLLMATFMG